MVPKVRIRPSLLRTPLTLQPEIFTFTRHYAATASAITPASSIDHGSIPSIPIQRYPDLQPPSYKRPDFRKTQVMRQYIATLKSSPIILFYQYNSVIAKELAAIRRELRDAMIRVDGTISTDYADYIKLQVIRNGLFDAALRLAGPWQASAKYPIEPSQSHMEQEISHSLSEAAYKATKKTKHGLERLLSGPLFIVSIPFTSPEHLKAVFSILSPSPEFPAPKRQAVPSYYELDVQSGLQKMMLLGARVEGKAFDITQARWVGGIQGGLDGLRAQLVATLQSAGSGLTSTLESAGRNLYFTLEGRKDMLEKEANPDQSNTPL
jgi:large subunit ribosomal protein L10